MRKLLFLGLLAGIFYSSCKKDTTVKPVNHLSAEDVSLVAAAKSYFNQDVPGGTVDTTYARQKLRKTPLWDRATVKTFSFGKGVLIPIKYGLKVLVNSNFNIKAANDLDNLSQLLIYQDKKGAYQVEVVTAFPDSLSNLNGKFSGFIKVETWSGNLLDEFIYSHDPKISTQKLSINGSGSKTGTSIVTTCNSLDVYVYSESAPDDGVYSVESMGCSSLYIPDENDAGGSANSGDYAGAAGGGVISSPAKVVTVDAGKHPVVNMAMFIRCFGNYKDATYSVTLCVDQPAVGERLSFSSFNDEGASGMFVGHAFLEFNQTVAGVVSRTAMGFYPAGAVTPFNPSSRGSLNDDSRHVYDVSLTIPMTGQQFMAVLTAFSSGNSLNYNLNTNNCATWALAALAKGGVVINTKKGNWPFGGGDDPGDLGEDLRNYNLTSGMSHNLAGGTAPVNVTPCSTADTR